MNDVSFGSFFPSKFESTCKSIIGSLRKRIWCEVYKGCFITSLGDPVTVKCKKKKKKLKRFEGFTKKVTYFKKLVIYFKKRSLLDVNSLFFTVNSGYAVNRLRKNKKKQKQKTKSSKKIYM